MVTNEVKKSAFAVIAATLEKYGPDFDFGKLRAAEFPNVPASTWYRWVAKIRATGIPVRAAVAAMKARKRKTSEKQMQEIERKAISFLPTAVSPGDVTQQSIIDVTKKINDCMAHADAVLALCLDGAGKVTNPDLYLRASRHHLDAMRTASAVADTLNDVKRTEEYHRAIFEVLRKRDPTIVNEILGDLKKLSAGNMFSIGGGWS